MLFTVLLSGLSSCKKDKDEPAPQQPASELLKQYKTGEEYIKFSYNTGGRVSFVDIRSDLNTGGEEVKYAVGYSETNAISSLEGDNGQLIVPVYENGQIIRADIYENNDRIGYTSQQFENNRLSIATLYAATDDGFEGAFEFRFAYNAAGNITQTVALLNGGQPGVMVRAGHIDFEYDQKTNPLYAQKDLLVLFWQGASKNNVILENHFDSHLQPEDRYSYVYSYLPNGLPEKATVTIGFPGQPATTTQVNYSY